MLFISLVGSQGQKKMFGFREREPPELDYGPHHGIRSYERQSTENGTKRIERHDTGRTKSHHYVQPFNFYLISNPLQLF
jgi:hypothetical protein